MEFKDLALAFGVSGCEDEVRDLIKQEIKDYADKILEDNFGNLIAIKGDAKKTVMLGAHMDEVGLMIVGIEKTGNLKFRPVGGIDQRVLLAKRVKIGKDRIPGVIGATPPHLDKDQNKVVELKSMYIDIGAKSKDEAEEVVTIGDYVEFDSGYYENGSQIFSKALDDRLGCYIMTNLIKSNIPGKIAYLFSVQEEVGLRGAQIVAERITPDIFISIEATGAGDFPIKDEEPGRPRIGGGPAITITDRSLIVPQDLIDLFVDCAKGSELPYQFKRPMIGGTDAGRISVSKSGVKAGVIAVPVRYIHSPLGIARKSDITATEKLLSKIIPRITEA